MDARSAQTGSDLSLPDDESLGQLAEQKRMPEVNPGRAKFLERQKREAMVRFSNHDRMTEEEVAERRRFLKQQAADWQKQLSRAEIETFKSA